MRIIEAERTYADPSAFIERPIELSLLLEKADRSFSDKFGLWPRLRERMLGGGSATVIAPEAVHPNRLLDLDSGLSMYRDHALFWLGENWQRRMKHGLDGFVVSEYSFGLPIAAFNSPPASIEVSMMANAVRGRTCERKWQRIEVVTSVVPLRTLAMIPDDEVGDHFNVTFWMDVDGPTCLTRHCLSDDILRNCAGSVSDFHAIVDGTVEAYFPVYDFESLAIWRPSS